MPDYKLTDPEKIDRSSDENGYGQTTGRRASVDKDGNPLKATSRKASVAASIVAADLLDERYNTTHRGLKSRHAQMIALGGED